MGFRDAYNPQSQNKVALLQDALLYFGCIGGGIGVFIKMIDKLSGILLLQILIMYVHTHTHRHPLGEQIFTT